MCTDQARTASTTRTAVSTGRISTATGANFDQIDEIDACSQQNDASLEKEFCAKCC
ncbi:hypothetical protein KDA_06560 [Dictyobacter alpinus]|uniref:Uncharacterized protein n=1 Tax=Dictyobacter alpinus TaxID=2014873 RepID=A0A402B1F1_9CHLR|nr:hypothetical protein KDA_06560 [Dictyobacter alpinus]